MTRDCPKIDTPEFDEWLLSRIPDRIWNDLIDGWASIASIARELNVSGETALFVRAAMLRILGMD